MLNVMDPNICAAYALSNCIPPIPSDPASMLMPRNIRRTGTPSSFDTLLAIILKNTRIDPIIKIPSTEKLPIVIFIFLKKEKD